MKLFSIRDFKSNHFVSPFPAENTDVALRLFTNEVQHSGGLVTKYPQDFGLYQIGSFNPDTGDVEGQLVQLIAMGDECKGA